MVAIVVGTLRRQADAAPSLLHGASVWKDRATQSLPRRSMASVEVKSFDSPDETRPFEGKGQAEVVQLAGQAVARATFEPGWKWSSNVKPIAQTDSCEVSHLGYCVSGRMKVYMDDGSEQEIGPGQAAAIPPGHDAEIVGDEPCVWLDFGEISDYAKR
jgi:uncharacterized cupin superfamily protein